MKEINKRKNIRLQGYDYSKSGYYFITICTQNRANILSTVGADLVSAQIELTYVGNIIEKILLNLEENFNVKIHDYIIMPNHVHFVIEILARADTRSAPTIGQIIKTFKTMSTTIISKEIKIGNIEPYNKRF